MKRKRHNCSKLGGVCCDLRDAESLNTYEQIVRHYIAFYRADAERELRHFRELPDIKTAIERAALAKLSNDKRHPHQYRIPQAKLEEARKALLPGVDLEQCDSFDELWRKVKDKIGPIKGIGELTVYDTALHIGAYRGFDPQSIHLHRGTRDGAKAIGLSGTRVTINVDELPDELPFDALSPREIEDCLCLYKDALRRIWQSKSGRGY